MSNFPQPSKPTVLDQSSNRRSCSPTRSNRRSRSPTRSNRRSRSPTRSNRRSRSPTRSNRHTHSPTRSNRHSHRPTRSNHHSRSPTRIISHIPTASRPTVKELDPELKRLVRWKSFAIQLPTIELSDVVEIEQNHRGNIADQRLAVYGTWLGKCVNASWLDVITALETIGENVLAEHLKVKCGLVLPHSSISRRDTIP